MGNLGVVFVFVVKNATRFSALCAGGFVLEIGDIHIDIGFVTKSAPKHVRTIALFRMARGTRGRGFLAFLGGGGGGE